jgi:2-polyprenyl-6-methoxyphenol hydroxylase-like FAD-dependent oxidoreductase
LQLSGGKIQYLFLQLIDRTEAKRTSEEGRMYAEHWSGTRRVLYTPCSDEDLYIALTMLNSDAQAGQVPVDKALWRSSFPQLAGVIDRIGDQGRWDPFEVVRLSAWSNGRLTIIGDAANALPPNLGQGGGCAMMNALSLAVIVSRFDDVAAGLREWERLERPLTDHTQRISLLYGRPTNCRQKCVPGPSALPGGIAGF